MASLLGTFEAVERQCKPTPGRTLIVGSKLYEGRPDRRKLYADAAGVDMLEGDGVDLVLNLEDPLPDIGKFSHIECLSVLEHSARPWLLAANLESLLAEGGTMFLAAPFVWRVHAYPNDYFRYTPEGVRLLFPSIKWDVLETVATTPKPIAPHVKHDGHPYFARSEVVGFGRK